MLFVLALQATLPMACTAEKATGYDLVIRNATIVGTYSGELLENRSIAIAGDSIVAIGDAAKTSSWTASRVIDAGAKFVIPGLWDMHVHFGGGDSLIAENKNLLPLFLSNGVTTVRDCSADISPSVFEWRAQIARGELLGPTIFSSGPKIEGVNSIWPGDQEVATPAELEKALDSLERVGADFVKITDNALSPELFEVALRSAHRRGFKVSGHIPFSLRAVDLSEMGLSTVEHMAYLVKAGSPEEAAIIARVASGEMELALANRELYETFDPDHALAVYKELHANNTAVVPTLIGSRIIAFLDEEDHQRDPELQYLGKGLIATYGWRVERANKDTPDQIAERKRRYRKLTSLITILKASKMQILAGTDAGFLNSYIYPGFALHEELQILVDGGLSPLEALQTSVVNGPEFFGLSDRYGSVEVGKKADLLILNTNPLQDIGATRDIFGLVRMGKVYPRADLDDMLSELAQRNTE